MMSQTELLTLKFYLSRYICSSAYNQLLVAHIMLKLFLYLPPVRPKFITKSQNQKCSEFIEIWHTQYFNYADQYFKIKSNFYEIFTTCQVQIDPKIKNTQNLLKFGRFDISNIPISILMSKFDFYEIFTFCQDKLTSRLKFLRNS